ncbi:FYVE zinc finger [Necator americanus]|uniref:FYVE zinc finger n=1 Tax=Necator americanus TaxID=51031 RepID=W2TYS7_NECAM|nr:FYVE zinc finger [Necator americanus]ETN87008.1 FYVE zinc finger [Necator americanus]
MQFKLVSFKNIEHIENNHPSSSKEKEWEVERERLLGQIVEREDSLRIVQQQLIDTKKINSDLYDKLKLADDKWRRLERDIARIREQYINETESLKKTISNLEVSNAILQENAQKKTANDEVMRTELEKKYGQHAELVGALQEKQNALAEELRELQEKYDCVSERAEESERALEEIGGHLSESKLRMLELAEELLPLSDAHWAKDSDVSQCTACSDKFSISKRKHHCRMCGSIFCAACSEGRIKLPSNSKPARVCDQCFNLLKNRQLGDT